MKIKQLVRSCIALLLFAQMIQPVLGNDDTVSGSTEETVYSGENNGQITTPAPLESINVTWCNVGQYATGYAINSGYEQNPSGGDSYQVTPRKSYLSDQCFSDFASAKNRAQSLSGSEDKVPVVIMVGAGEERIAYAKYGVVLLNNSQTSATFTIHTSPNASTKKTYVNATSQRDALMIDVVSPEWAYVMMSGADGYLKLTNSSGAFIHQIVPATFIDKTSAVYSSTIFYGYKLTRYGVNPNDSTSMFLDVLRGTGTSSLITSGNADRPSFMQLGKVYLSYGGHYFYETISAMTEDIRSGSNSRALNQTPYYNYYQYLPARAKTRMTGQAFNSFLLLNKPTAGDQITTCYSSSGVTVSCSGSYAYKYSGPQSILYNNGSAFLQGQDNYGVNAALIYVKATLEGAYGMSTISRAKYNPFGVNANDSSPFSSATKYATVYAGIESQFKTLMSLGYVNPFDGGGRYNGSHVGDKQSGINTLYASDPNWGFKLASIYRELDKLSGFADLNFYQLAVTTKQRVNLYTTATGSTVKQVIQNHNTVNNYVFDAIDIPLIIVSGETNGRYKVVMDAPSDTSSGYFYSKDSDYGYVNASDIRMINTAKSGFQDPKNIGNAITDPATDVVTYDTPRVLKATMNTNLYDSYRTDIAASTTPINANATFVAIREVKTAEGTYYEVITDYTRAPARTKWIKANTATFTGENIVVTQGSSLNVRASASTSAESKAVIASDRSALLYLSTAQGTAVNGNSNWYKVVLNPLTGDSGYISAAYATMGGTQIPDPTTPTNPSTSTINRIKSLFVSSNPYILGTGVVSGVNASNQSAITYTLLFTSGSAVYTHPLRTTTNLTSLTNDSTFNPTGSYNYDYAWYEGTIDFYGVSKEANSAYQSLPSGTYKLAVKATGNGANSTFPLVNGDQFPLGGLVVVDGTISYQFTQDANQELSIVVTNTGVSTPTPPTSGTEISNDSLLVSDNNRMETLTAKGSVLSLSGYSFSPEMNYDTASAFTRELVLVNTSTKEVYSHALAAYKNTFLTNHATVNPGKIFNYDYAFYRQDVDLNAMTTTSGSKVALPAGEYAAYIRMASGTFSGHTALKNALNLTYVAGTTFSTGSYQNTQQMRVVVKGDSSNGGSNPSTPNPNGIDLSYYSNGKFPIYENSRVVYAAHAGNALTLKGYSLEQFNNYHKADAFVREIIFLNKNDPSNPDKAFRLSLKSVYDAYLNANKTLNPNGKYNYSYAYYGGSIDLSKVRVYTKPENSTRVSLPAGEYLVYIRMSDGKRSNLMSLKSTKSDVILPSTFKVEANGNIVFTRK